MSAPFNKSKKFLRDESGSAVIIGSLLAATGMILAGVSMEYGRAVSHKQELQQALDAATLAVCQRGTRSATEALTAHINASLENSGKKVGDGEDDIKLTNAEPDAQGVVNPTLTSTLQTPMLEFPLFSWLDMDSQSGLTVNAEAAVACGSRRLELSLMLDVTGSMCWPGAQDTGVYSCDANSTGNKLESMKKAVDDVLDIFGNNMAAGKAKIGVVPFSETVNVGDLADTVRGVIPEGTSDWPGYKHYQHPDEDWEYWQTKRITNCVTEREGPQAYTDASPATAKVGLHYGPNDGSCNPTAEILPLTTDATAISNHVWALSGAGSTAGQIGHAWAWYLLSPNWSHLWPASGVEQPNEKELVKATILMTDGDYNAQYCEGVKDYDNGWCQSVNGASRDQAKQMCQSMKENGIVIYTVGFHVQVSGDENNPTPQEKLLKECATDSTKYFFPYDGDELRAAFVEIGNQLVAGQAGMANLQK